VLNELVTQLLNETVQTSVRLLSPELTLLAGIVVSLLIRCVDLDRQLPCVWVMLWSSLTAFSLGLLQWHDFNHSLPTGLEYFSGLMVIDRFAAMLRFLLLLFLVLTIALTLMTELVEPDDATDFFTLLFGSTIGLLLLPGANHLLMVFLAIEMASVPSYALVGYLKGRRDSSEAALKFVVYGAGAAGVLLYGISLLCGVLGTASLPELSIRLKEVLTAEGGGLQPDLVRLVMLAMVMIIGGIAFKLSIVPFHFWCPDAFQGATAEVAGYLSVASKIGVLGVTVRLGLALFGGQDPGLQPLGLSLALLIGLLAAVTVTFGNLAAYPQQNLKRLFAYSTIAHSGYMLMAVAALLALQNAGSTEFAGSMTLPERSARAVEGLLYYVAVYLFMNLGVFAVTAVVRNATFEESVSRLQGLGTTSPGVALAMALCLFSLIGLPPMGGFVGKLFVFTALYDAGMVHPGFWVLLAVGAANTVISLFYYANLLRMMYLLPADHSSGPVTIPVGSWCTVFLLILSMPLLVLGIHVQLVSQAARAAAVSLFP
jgi:NADH-quinone oxidoreductase subunit N